MQNHTFIKGISWAEIFQTWKFDEGSKKSWQECAKEKGWNTWEEWRKNTSVNFLKTDQKEWKLYRVQEPLIAIPNYLVGPFKSWRARLQDNHTTFAQLVNDSHEWAASHKGIQRIQKGFPWHTQFIGFIMPDKENIMLFEGHHRATALALSMHDGYNISSEGNPTIALSQIDKSDLKRMDELLHRGTKK